MALRLGLIGRGRWGRNIERTLLGFPGVQVTAMGRDHTFSAAFDAILIATPSATHAELALPYIEAGVPTYVDKPMATTVAGAQRIAAAAAQSGAPVFVGHIFLYHPAFLALLAALPGLGAVRRISCEGMNDNPRKDSSVLWDWAPHHLAIAHAVMGCDASSVESRATAAGGLAAETAFRFGGVPVVSSVSWRSAEPRSVIAVECEKGTVALNDKASHRLTLRTPAGEVSDLAYANVMPLTVELSTFLEVVRTRRPDMDHIGLSVAIVREIVAAERALTEGRAVTIQHTP